MKQKITRGARVTNLLWMPIALGIAGTTAIMDFSQAESLSAPSANSGEFHEGQVFPTMVFPSLDGKRPGSVADFRGRKLILHIFASW